MNLHERSKQLSEKITALIGLKKRSVFAGEIEKRATTLDALSNGLQPLIDVAQVLAQHGIPVYALDRKLLFALRAKTADLQLRFAADKAAIQNPFPDQDFRFCFEQPLKKCAESSKAGLTSAWAHWANGLLPKLDEEVLFILAAIPALQRQVGHIKMLRLRAAEIVAVLPRSNEPIAEITAIAQEIATEWQGLAGDGIAPRVLDFLRAAGGQDGAGYDLLTPEVLGWLSDNGLVRSLRIHMG